MTRQKAIEILEGLAVPINAEAAFDMAIDALKQPETIRCKDCKYKELQQDWKYRSYAHMSIWKCGKGRGKDITDSVQENDYCAWPER